MTTTPDLAGEERPVGDVIAPPDEADDWDLGADEDGESKTFMEAWRELTHAAESSEGDRDADTDGEEAGGS